MARNCPSCGAALEYDPGSDTLVCEVCGNLYEPASFEDEEEVTEENTPSKKLSYKDYKKVHYGGAYFDSYIFKCSQCGGEVIVAESEISTKCVYCGSTAVAFSRISKTKKPDYIVPFMITKEQAIEEFKKHMTKGFFVPRAFRKLDPDCVRGIYLPADLYSGTWKDVQTRKGGSEAPDITMIGECEIEDHPAISCSIIPRETAELLEPFYLSSKEEFNTSYLMGFYSNAANVEETVTEYAAEKRIQKKFNERLWEAFGEDDVSKLDKALKAAHINIRLSEEITSCAQIQLEKTSYALLPVWFITVRYENQPHTFLVNGQTGEVVGMPPINKKLFVGLFVSLFAVITAMVTVLFFAGGALDYMFDFDVLAGGKEGDLQTFIGVLLFLIGIPLISLGVGFGKLIQVTNRHSLTTKPQVYKFAQDRQGDKK